MSWRTRVCHVDTWPSDDIDYAIFIDENGDANLKHAIDAKRKGRPIEEGNRFFQISACCVCRSDIEKIRNDVLSLKQRHWPNGMFMYNGCDNKRVCFHSRDIRRKVGPFSSNVINRTIFLNELTSIMASCNYKIAAYCIDKYALVSNYKYPEEPYALAVDFLLERIVRNFVPPDKRCILVLETRTKQNDQALLNRIIYTLDFGTEYVNPKQLSCVSGVYFNPKWCISTNNQCSYFCLEIADLVGYPIYKYLVRGNEDAAFQAIKHKIIGFPDRMNGIGLKKFPIN